MDNFRATDPGQKKKSKVNSFLCNKGSPKEAIIVMKRNDQSILIHTEHSEIMQNTHLKEEWN